MPGVLSLGFNCFGSDMRVIELTQGHVTTVDDEDFERLAQYRWHARSGKDGIRAARSVNYQKEDGKRACYTVYMAVEIMNPQNGMVVDHISGQTLDNRRSNLRVCKKSDNCKNRKLAKSNSTGFKGVFVLNKPGKPRFYASVSVNKKKKHLGCFGTAEEAHAAYCQAAAKIYGEFARLN